MQEHAQFDHHLLRLLPGDPSPAEHDAALCTERGLALACYYGTHQHDAAFDGDESHSRRGRAPRGSNPRRRAAGRAQVDSAGRCGRTDPRAERCHSRRRPRVAGAAAAKESSANRGRSESPADSGGACAGQFPGGGVKTTEAMETLGAEPNSLLGAREMGKDREEMNMKKKEKERKII